MKEERIIKSQTPLMDMECEIAAKASRIKNSATTACVGIATAMMMPASAYAAGDLVDSVTKALNTMVDALVKIAIPVYILTAVICLVMIVASSGRKAEMAKDWLIRATIGIIAIGSLGAIKSFIMGVDGMNFGGYNE